MKVLVFLYILGGLLFAEASYKYCDQDWRDELRCEDVLVEQLEEDIGDSTDNSIKILVLKNNSLHHLRETTRFWRHFPNLESLEITENQLYVIPEDTFDGLFNLKKLSLARNNLKSYPASALSRLNTLKHVNVSENRISGPINSLWFARTPNVEILDLSKNRINGIHRSPFKVIPKLTTLNLAETYIKILEGHNLKGIKYLSELILRSTQLTGGIAKDVFQNTPSLTHLDLRNAGLKALTMEVLSPLDQLERLYLSGNQFECDDCKMEWIWKELTNKTHNWNNPLVGFDVAKFNGWKIPTAQICFDHLGNERSFQDLAKIRKSTCVQALMKNVWTGWSQWSPCTKSCKKTRTRMYTFPSLVKNGSPWHGNVVEKIDCLPSECPDAELPRQPSSHKSTAGGNFHSLIKNTLRDKDQQEDFVDAIVGSIILLVLMHAVLYSLLIFDKLYFQRGNGALKSESLPAMRNEGTKPTDQPTVQKANDIEKKSVKDNKIASGAYEKPIERKSSGVYEKLDGVSNKKMNSNDKQDKKLEKKSSEELVENSNEHNVLFERRLPQQSNSSKVEASVDE